LNDAKRATENAKKALEIDPNNAKACYRMGKAFNMVKEYEEALKMLKKADEIEPCNATKKEISTVIMNKKIAKEKEMKGFFNK